MSVVPPQPGRTDEQLHGAEEKRLLQTGKLEETAAVIITPPCLSFLTHSGVERKLCVAGAGGATKQALRCER